MLRGIYFTSGTQEGTPIDRLTGALARAFGVDQRRAPSLRPEQGRSYFLGRLLERGGVRRGHAGVRSRPGRAGGGLMLRAWRFARSLLVTARRRRAAVAAARSANQRTDRRQCTRRSPRYEPDRHRRCLSTRCDDADLLARAAAARPRARHEPTDGACGRATRAFGLGLSQYDKLGRAARTVYRHALERVLLPRLIWRMEAQIRGNLARPDFVYEATRVYLMLGSAGPLDPGLVKAWMTSGLGGSLPRSGCAGRRATRCTPSRRAARGTAAAIDLDGALVAAARATFSRVPLAERVYSRIKPSAAAQHVPPWRPSDALGACGLRGLLHALRASR